MSLIRRRYYAWLVKAYFKRWSRTIISSLVIGVVVFFVVVFTLNFYILPVMQGKIQKIGYWGAYTINNIPTEVLQDISYGLTRIQEDGTISPGAAYRWQIKDGGRQYIFYIKKGQYFHNKTELTAQALDVNFKDVRKKAIDDHTVSLSLKDPYSPFLTSVSSPIFNKNFSGLGVFRLKKMDLNAGFVKSINLINKKDASFRKIIIFYPTQEALKTAFLLGEVDKAVGITTFQAGAKSIRDWANVDIQRDTDYGKLVALFYNNADSLLSDKKMRQALGFAIPREFNEGERTYSPISPRSIYFSKSPNYGISDLEIAKDIVDAEKDIKAETLIISSSEELKPVAQKISSEWRKIGVNSKVNVLGGIPEKFQILLYTIKLPQDPDQYTLWHTGQVNNITNYKNLRIDKLLEDGRETVNQGERITIYSDFQKYLIDDAPASFLYFPYQYTLTRK